MVVGSNPTGGSTAPLSGAPARWCAASARGRLLGRLPLAYRILREGGLRKSQLVEGSRPSTTSFEDLGCVDLGPRGIARRSYEDGGWTPWAPVPVGCSLNWRDSGDVRLGQPTAGGYRRPRTGS